MNKIISSLFIGLLSFSFMGMSPVKDNNHLEPQVVTQEVEPKQEPIYVTPVMNVPDEYDPSGTVTIDVKSSMSFFYKQTLEIKVTNTTGVKVAYGWVSYSTKTVTDKGEKTSTSGFFDGAHYEIKPGTSTIYVPVKYSGKLQSVELLDVHVMNTHGLPISELSYKPVDESIDKINNYSGEAIAISVGVVIISLIVLAGFLLAKKNNVNPIRNMGAVMLAGVPVCWVLGVVISLICFMIGNFGKLPIFCQLVPYMIAISLVQILVIPVAFILIAIGRKRAK